MGNFLPADGRTRSMSLLDDIAACPGIDTGVTDSGLNGYRTGFSEPTQAPDGTPVIDRIPAQTVSPEEALYLLKGAADSGAVPPAHVVGFALDHGLRGMQV